MNDQIAFDLFDKACAAHPHADSIKDAIYRYLRNLAPLDSEWELWIDHVGEATLLRCGVDI